MTILPYLIILAYSYCLIFFLYMSLDPEKNIVKHLQSVYLYTVFGAYNPESFALEYSFVAVFVSKAGSAG